MDNLKKYIQVIYFVNYVFTLCKTYRDGEVEREQLSHL